MGEQGPSPGHCRGPERVKECGTHEPPNELVGSLVLDIPCGHENHFLCLLHLSCDVTDAMPPIPTTPAHKTQAHDRCRPFASFPFLLFRLI